MQQEIPQVVCQAFMTAPSLRLFRASLSRTFCPSSSVVYSRRLPICPHLRSFVMSTPSSEAQIISPQEAHERFKSDSWAFVDVRTEQEYEQGHPSGSICVPFMNRTPDGKMTRNESFLNDLKKAMEREQNPTKNLIVSCGTGKRSGMACRALKDEGYKLLDVQGGFGEWVKNQDLPTEKGTSVRN